MCAPTSPLSSLGMLFGKAPSWRHSHIDWGRCEGRRRVAERELRLHLFAGLAADSNMVTVHRTDRQRKCQCCPTKPGHTLDF